MGVGQDLMENFIIYFHFTPSIVQYVDISTEDNDATAYITLVVNLKYSNLTPSLELFPENKKIEKLSPTSYVPD